MSLLDRIIDNIPQIEGPKEQKLPFKTKTKWTLIILVAFFILGLMPLFGLQESALENFQFLEIVLGASIGSIISLGIGPIVTASIVLQLLNGSGIINFDTSSSEGKKRFQGVQKMLATAFIFLQSYIFVSFGGLTPLPEIPAYVIVFQLVLGGFMIMLMDEVVSKWGFGQGISLFIVAGVSKQIFVQLINPLTQDGGYSVGHLFRLFQSIQAGDGATAAISFFTILATLAVFAIVVYTQAMKVEIPLSFGRVRGHGMRWPLNFFYTSNIPVILIAALIANIQLVSQLVSPGGELTNFLQPPNLIQLAAGSGLEGILQFDILLRSLVYIGIFVVGSVIFGIFWVQTAGLDAQSQAKNIMKSGLQIPGFRKDKRVLERMLDRYIWPLAVMGSITVGLLASIADLTGALGSGTGILLTVMIIYRLYEEIAREHMMDMNPAMRKFVSR